MNKDLKNKQEPTTMKGVILLGGEGTRLAPSTAVVNKQLLPIYDKPMCYYSMSILFLAKIQDILIITSPHHVSQYVDLFGDGSRFGVRINYAIQKDPDGIPQALMIGKDFIGQDPVCLVLGDNILYGHGITGLLLEAATLKKGALCLTRQVENPQRFGIVEVDNKGRVLSLEEKPKKPKSNLAVIGIYFLDNESVKIAETLKKSKRGEYEILDLLAVYLKKKELKTIQLGRGQAWLDTGTHAALLRASNFVHALQETQHQGIAVLEEIVYNNGWITKKELSKLVSEMNPDNPYRKYLESVVEKRIENR